MKRWRLLLFLLLTAWPLLMLGQQAVEADRLLHEIERAQARGLDRRLDRGLAAHQDDRDVGRPLHCLVIPGERHFMEKEALVKLAGAPKDL